MANEFVFVMDDLRKVVGEGRVILDQISLSFFPGAKIGVLGHNGAGKSSLLRIMAGLDDDYLGEARPLKGIRVGFLSQEPELDATKTVLGNGKWRGCWRNSMRSAPALASPWTMTR